MLTKHLFLLFLLLLAPLACGPSGKDGAATEIEGIPISGSSYHGIAIAATNVEETVKTSRIYYYEFSTGKVLELLGAESGNPAVFFADSRVYLFNRSAEIENFRSFDPKAATITPTEPIALTGITNGDPWDVASLKSGQTLLLASPLGAKLQVLDVTTGVVGDATSSSFASGALRPHALLRQSNKVYIAHGGVDATGAGDGSQALFSATVTAEGNLAFADADPDTAGEIDGRPLSATNPAGFLNVNSSSALIPGLCFENMPSCDAGADRLNLANGTVTNVSSLTSLSDKLVSGMTSGQATDSVYAHVKNADGAYNVVNLDVKTKQTSIVHTYSDARLYALAYDASTKTLLVGSRDGLSGALYLYRDGQLFGSFALPSVPYHTALVSN
jgi:hypothetical protein